MNNAALLERCGADTPRNRMLLVIAMLYELALEDAGDSGPRLMLMNRDLPSGQDDDLPGSQDSPFEPVELATQ
jgi:hypothetical protein